MEESKMIPSIWKEQRVVEAFEVDAKRRLKPFVLFRVSSTNGQRLASATGAWMVLDKDSYRPQKLEQLMAAFPWQKGKSELEGNLRKVVESTNGQDRIHYRVLFSDLDVNNHVNAARYLQWVWDGYPREVLENRQMESVEISFLAEATIDDEIAVYFERIADKDISVIRSIKDRKDLCRAAIRWRP
jgi:acyl-ACP thioesterase